MVTLNASADVAPSVVPKSSFPAQALWGGRRSSCHRIKSKPAQFGGSVTAGRVVRTEVPGMDRVSILQRLMNILFVQPRSLMAFRDFESVADDDLRSALEDTGAMIDRTT